MIRPLLVTAVALGVLAGCGRAGDAGDEAVVASVPSTPSTSIATGEPGGSAAAGGDVPAAPAPRVATPVRPVGMRWVAPRLAPQYDVVAASPRPAWVDASTCPAAGRAAVVDRARQWGWLCHDGRVARDFPITSARSQPDPGTYDVYAKDARASSTISGAYSEMTHFVAFTYGKYQGARIAFHSVPTSRDGSYVQPLDSVGTAELFGASAGCIRVLPDDAVAIWDWLAMGDDVVVIS